MATLTRLCLIVAALVLTACATNYHPTPYWMIQESMFKSLVPGVTTKDEVLNGIGVPLTQSHFPRQNEDVWEYQYLDGSATRMLAYVYFDPNGVYKYSYRILDPAVYSGPSGHR